MYYTLSICLLLIYLDPDLSPFREPPDHSAWDKLLSIHVNKEGVVDYNSFLKDHGLLKEYLSTLSGNPPGKDSWTRNERLAYWINAYNAFTVHLILEHYPVESIKDIGPWLEIPFINSVFDKKFIEIEGKKMSLNNIEHDIIRKRFEEPRIHFALVCAARSCPELRDEAYLADQLENQLQDQAVKFIQDPSKNIIRKGRLKLSRIFLWYKADFTGEGTLIDYIRKFTDQDISSGAGIDYLDYDWSLNDIRGG